MRQAHRFWRSSQCDLVTPAKPQHRRSFKVLDLELSAVGAYETGMGF